MLANQNHAQVNRVQLKCCLIDAGVDSAILFRFDLAGSYIEHVMADEVFKKQSTWSTTLEFEMKYYYWFHLDVMQRNQNGYQVKLFAIKTPRLEGIAPQKFILLGKFICDHVNKGNKFQRRMIAQVANESDYFWIPTNAVWADVIGHEAAYSKLIEKIGRPNGEANFYRMNKSCIDSYFHTGTYSIHLARVLGAPIQEVHPNQRAEFLILNQNF